MYVISFHFYIPIAFFSIFLPIKMRPTPVQDRRPGTSADVPDVPSPTSMVIALVTKFQELSFAKIKNRQEGSISS